LPNLKELVLEFNPIAMSQTFSQGLSKAFPNLMFYNMMKLGEAEKIAKKKSASEPPASRSTPIQQG
jgi:hypothetical protein